MTNGSAAVLTDAAPPWENSAALSFVDRHVLPHGAALSPSHLVSRLLAKRRKLNDCKAFVTGTHTK